MKTFRYQVSIPPNDVLQRLGGVVETSGVRSLAGPAGKKRFIGNLTGNQFSFRRWRWTKNSLASTCFGRVDPQGSGSVITGNIGGKYGCFLTFAIGFVLLATLVPAGMIGMITLATAGAPATPETTHTLRTYWAVVGLVPLALTAFFTALFLLGRALTRPDETEMAALFPSLFADVLASQST